MNRKIGVIFIFVLLVGAVLLSGCEQYVGRRIITNGDEIKDRDQGPAQADFRQPEQPDMPNVYINEDNMLVINGKPTFIIGEYPFWGLAYDGREETPTFHSIYTNSIVGFGDDVMAPGQQHAQHDLNFYWLMKSLSSHKEYVFLGNWNSFGLTHSRNNREEPIFDFDVIEENLQCLSKFDNFVGWHNREEPVWSNYEYEEIYDIYENFKRIDPDHPVWMHFAPAHPTDNYEEWVDDLWLYSAAADIISSGIYPIPRNPCGPENEEENHRYCVFENDEISVVGDIVDALIDITYGEKPVWMVLQGDDVNYEQSQFMIYQAIIHGANGVWYYGIKNKEGITELRREISSLDVRNILSSPTLIQEINTEDGIEYIIKSIVEKDDNEYYYLIAVNRDNSEKSKEFNIDSDADEVIDITEIIEEARRPWEEDTFRTIEMNNGIFTDNFDPFGAYVYKIPIIHEEDRKEPAKRAEI